MSNYTALYDACVLYPFAIRDLLMNLSQSGLYRTCWTDEIHDEWISNLVKNRPDLKPERLARTRKLMNAAVPDCLVTGYQHLTDKLQMPDPGDRHVLAAAIVAGADVIVTYNLKHFPASILDLYEIEAQHPDDFILCQFDLHPGLVCKWIKIHRESMKFPPKSIDEYLGLLRGQQLVQTVSRLLEFKDLL